MQSMRTAVPAANSADNLGMADVIGSKLDDQDGTSLFSRVHDIDEHVHSASKVYPTLADGVAVTAGAAWVLGAFVEIVPINTIAIDFDIHYVSVEALDTNDEYELVLYAVEVEIGRCRFTKNANLDATMNVPVQTAIQAANVQIQAKLATDAGASIATISIFYHEYP